VLQCVAACCNLLWCVDTDLIFESYFETFERYLKDFCKCVAGFCSVLQRVAVYCGVLIQC